MKFKRLYLLIICALIIFTSPSKAKNKNNFLFILVDDLGYMDIGIYNPNCFYETPNIDRLARQGIRFTNAYAACPVCSPTRASIMTGKYPARENTTDWFGAAQPETHYRNSELKGASYEDKMALEEYTLAEALKDNNYKTFIAGKWHLGHEGFYPEDQGFEINKGGWAAGGPYTGNKYFSPFKNPKLEDHDKKEHLPDRLANETIEFLKQNKDNQFFAYLSFYSVHAPFISREDLIQKYQEKKSKENKFCDTFGKEGNRHVRITQGHEKYAAMVESMDLAVGKVLNSLYELGLNSNTIVVFMSDNGGLSTAQGHPTSNAPLRGGKGWIYEGGIREPLIIKWPEIKTCNEVIDVPVISTDFYPTFLEIAGISLLPRQHRDGKSLVPLLKNQEDIKRKALFWHYPHYSDQGGMPASAIRKGDYKYIKFYGEKEDELYNLREDIGETNNLIKVEPKLAKKLQRELDHWLKSVDAQYPTKNENFDPKKPIWN